MPDSKPSLAALIEAQAAGPRKPGMKSAATKQPRRIVPPVPTVPPAEQALRVEIVERPAELVRELLVRRFVTAYLREHLNAAAALRSVRPDVKKRYSKQLAYELLQCDDVRAELFRQLKGISDNADLDEDWVYRRWRAMANSNILDYVTIDPATGAVTFNLDKHQLTLEQQLNIRRLKLDPKTSRIVDLELIDCKSVVDSIAKARRLFRELDDETTESLAREITERMQSASKRIPRTFDHDLAEECAPPAPDLP